jgi:Spy/CpxP family protein refolding chaperone
MILSAPAKIVLSLAVIFCAGAVSGGVLGWNSARNSLTKPPTVERVCNKMRDSLQSRLNLTPEQMQKVQPILDQTGRDLHKIHRRTLEEVQMLFAKSNAEIAKELTPEQQAKFEQLNKERLEFWRNRLKTGKYR